MGLGDFLEIFTKDLTKIPRRRNNDGSENANYDEDRVLFDKRVATMTGLIGLLLVSHIAWTGWGPGAFATATDLQAINKRQIAQELEKAYTSLCMRPGDPDLLAWIRSLEEEYRKAGGSEYNPKDCKLLQKLANN